MNTRDIIISALCYVMVVFTRKCQGAEDSPGVNFVLGFLESNCTNSSELIFASEGTSQVSVTVSMPGDPTFNPINLTLLPAHVTALPLTLDRSDVSTSGTGILINSSHPISIWGRNTNSTSTDGFLALPVTCLGKQYIISSYRPNVDYLAAVTIVGVENDTVIQVIVPVKNTGTRVRHQGVWYTEGATFSVTVDAYQRVDLVSDVDITGLSLVCNKNTAVFSGTVYKTDSAHSSCALESVEQLPPVSNWGVATVDAVFGGEETETVFRVIAAGNETTVRIRYTGGETSHTLNSSSFVDFNVTEKDVVCLESSRPTLVMRYQLRDSSFCSRVIPPLERWLETYHLGLSGQAEGFYVITSDELSPDQVLLNSEPVSNVSSEVVRGGYTTNYTASRIASLMAWAQQDSNGSSSNSQQLMLTATSSNSNSSMPFFISTACFLSTMGCHDAGAHTTAATDATVPARTTNMVVVIPGNPAVGETNYAETSSTDNSGPVLSSSVIAVIVSLSSAVFFVIACIVGFLAAEVVCRAKPFRTSKVTPFIG